MDKKTIGSQTAKGGFANEHDLVAKFNNWQQDIQAQKWLEIMGYDFKLLSYVKAIQIPTKIKKNDALNYGVTEEEYEKFVKYKKADAQIKLIIKIGEIQKIENISLKKSNDNADFNQIDKRNVDSYREMWGFDQEIALWLKLFSGEYLAKNYPDVFKNTTLREQKRIFMDEMPINIQEKIIAFFDQNRILIANDILKGRGGLSANWILVTRKNQDQTYSYVLKEINQAINFYGMGEIKISPRGSLAIGKLFLQRKGGTPDPTKLQFKFKPCDLFDLE